MGVPGNPNQICQFLIVKVTKPLMTGSCESPWWVTRGGGVCSFSRVLLCASGLSWICCMCLALTLGYFLYKNWSTAWTSPTGESVGLQLSGLQMLWFSAVKPQLLFFSAKKLKFSSFARFHFTLLPREREIGFEVYSPWKTGQKFNSKSSSEQKARTYLPWEWTLQDVRWVASGPSC